MKLKFFTRIGGKNKIREKIVSLFPDEKEYSTFIEPFVGSGQVMLEILPNIYNNKTIVINDKNEDIYYLWKDLKNVNKKKILAYNWKGDKELFYQLKNKKVFQSSEDRFYRNFYISLYSYSGHRDSGYAEKNVNRGTYFFKIMKTLKDYLKKIKIYNNDYKNIIKKYDSKNTLFYLDPPYLEKEKLYENQSVDPENILKICENIKGKFILSYNIDKKIKNLFKNFNIRKIKVPYTSGNKKYKYEYIITNF